MILFIECMETSRMLRSIPESFIIYSSSFFFILQEITSKKAKQLFKQKQGCTSLPNPIYFHIPFNPSMYPLMHPASFIEQLTIYLPF